MMKKKVSLFLNRRSALIASALATAMAAHAAAAPQVPEVAVRERAAQRWQALIDGKYQDAYDMLAPGVRALQSFKAYSNSIGAGATWTAAEVTRVDCNDKQDNCTATVRVESKALMPGGSFKVVPLTTHLAEIWIKQDNQWWLFPKS